MRAPHTRRRRPFPPLPSASRLRAAFRRTRSLTPAGGAASGTLACSCGPPASSDCPALQLPRRRACVRACHRGAQPAARLAAWNLRTPAPPLCPRTPASPSKLRPGQRCRSRTACTASGPARAPSGLPWVGRKRFDKAWLGYAARGTAPP
ncbi:hypothetical protein FA95DRAFT_1684889 [Auriscalpium vulgare]|uniref:Uncharacterized protein n=1 Tax=Auriscalpium vulgare TaxID=40419 RepID=A0ACB8QZW3_9AGAM|nr:hypothetical protein FA95DRAFT_1684889 [Auriscalpium vulgare]